MKRVSLMLAVVMMGLMLSSCALIPATRLEAMFRTDTESPVISSGTDNSTDTVTISRAEYEKYRQDAEKVARFSDMFTILDAASQDFIRNLTYRR